LARCCKEVEYSQAWASGSQDESVRATADAQFYVSSPTTGYDFVRIDSGMPTVSHPYCISLDHSITAGPAWHRVLVQATRRATADSAANTTDTIAITPRGEAYSKALILISAIRTSYPYDISAPTLFNSRLAGCQRTAGSRGVPVCGYYFRFTYRRCTLLYWAYVRPY